MARDSLRLSRSALTRLEWIIYYEKCASASLTARHFGIVPKTFYKWYKRFNERNLASLEEQSKPPLNNRERAITPLEETRVVDLRKKYIRWGKMKLQIRYKAIYGTDISSWKIQYTIAKYKLYYHPEKNRRTQKKRLTTKKKKRITELKKQPFTGYLIALDIIVIYWNGLKRYILTAIDTTSKIAFARMYTTKSSRNTADFLRRMVYLMDGEVLNSLNDNGSEFHKEYIEACKELGLEQYWSRVRTPKDNPVCERFNRTIQDEFIDLSNFTPNPILFNRKLTEWLIEYTFDRPHQTLGYLTPWQFYCQSKHVDPKVLPMYSSSTTT